jgi:conjugative transfer signal peptidase TraF
VEWHATCLCASTVGTRLVSTQRAAARSRLRAPAAGLIAIAILAAPALPLRVNWTASMPRGLYCVRPTEPRAGAAVLSCLPERFARLGRARGYLARGSCAGGVAPVLKRIAALPGDLVEIREDALVVNGVMLTATHLRERDSLGRPLSHAPLGTWRVGEREVWLLGARTERSWDSRYFGPVPVASLMGSAEPVVTWNAGE